MIQILFSQPPNLPATIHSFALARSLVLLLMVITWLGYGSVQRVYAASPAHTARAVLLSNIHFDPPDPELPVELPQSVPASLTGAAAERLLLPDLETLPPSDLEIETLPDGSRELRLSNMIWNSGEGPLELEGIHNTAVRQTVVVQHIHASVGTPHNHWVGQFVYHPTHDHWHFAEFTLYELWSLTPASALDEVLSSSDKLSYCVIDTDVIAPEHPSFEARKRYYGCGSRLQGLSAGWGDEYKSHLDGQSIHLQGVKDGFYALKSTANPDSILLEADYSNNAALLYLEVRGERLEQLTHDELVERRCQQAGHC